MATNAKYSGNLKIIRPFLHFKKTDLNYVTLNYFKAYIEDPSNEDEKFLRVRIRKYRKKYWFFSHSWIYSSIYRFIWNSMGNYE